MRNEFSKKEWMPIIISSQIRNEWDYKINGFQKLLFSFTNVYIRKIVTRFFAPRTPMKTCQKLDEEFYKNLIYLVRKIKNDIL